MSEGVKCRCEECVCSSGGRWRAEEQNTRRRSLAETSTPPLLAPLSTVTMLLVFLF